MYIFSFNKSSISAARTLVFAFMLLFGTQGIFAMAEQEAPVKNDTLTVTDMRGRIVTLPAQIDSIIALDAGSLRLVSYMGAADKIIAVEDAGHGREKSDYGFFSLATYRLAYPGFRNLPGIGNAENHEGIIAANPDLIIASTVDVSLLDQLQNVLGIPVFAVNADVELYDTDLFYDQLTKLGQVLNNTARADELIAGIDGALNDLKERASRTEEAKKVYAGGMMYYGPADLLRTTGDYLPFDLCGAQNVMPTNPAGNLQPYMTSLEDLIAAVPDYAFIDTANIHLSKGGFETNRALLEEQVPAFAEGQVYSTFVYKYYGTNWENQLINAYYVGKVLYPELYADFDIDEKAEEIWQLFFEVSLDYEGVVNAQNGGPARVDWFS